MNKIYKSIWNEQTGTYVAVSENTKAKGKRSSSALLASAILAAVVGTAQAQTVEELDERLTIAEDSITQLQTDLGTANTNIGNLQSGLSTAQGNITDLQSGLSAAEGNITGLQSGLSAAEGNITDLQSGLSTAEGNITGLQSGLSAAEGNITDLQSGLSAAEGNITGLQSGLSTAEGNITDLQSGLSAAEGNITNLQSGLSTAQGNITDLQSGLSTAQSNIDALQTDYDAFVIATNANFDGLTQKLTDLGVSDTIQGIKYFRVQSTLPDAEATGLESIAIGQNAKALANNSMAIGQNAQVLATGANGIAIGQDSEVAAENAFAAGVGAKVTTEGKGAIAFGQGALAGGGAPGAGGERAVAIGRASVASGTSSVALGDGAKAQATNATALGANALAGAGNSIAIGNSKAESKGAIAAGNGAYAGSPNGIALGTGAGVGTTGNTAEDRVSHIAIGNNAGRYVSGNQTIAIGDGAGSDIKGSWNVAIGAHAGTGVRGNSNISIGGLANKDAGTITGAIAIGEETNAETDAVSIGYKAKSLDTGVALGSYADAGAGAVALGRNTSATGGSVALGIGSAARSSDAVGSGYITGNTFTDGTVVSVGNSNTGGGDALTRRIVNLEDGAQATDAVNVRQLKAAEQKVANLVGVGVNASTGAYEKIKLLKTGGDPENPEDYVEFDNVALAIGAMNTGGYQPIDPDVVTYNTTGQINNVVAGTLGTDAVNVQQMNEAIAEKGVKYFSVNSSKPLNRDNTSATGVDAIAIGPDSHTKGKSSIAAGYLSRGVGAESVAIGYNVEAHGNNSTVVGNSSKAYHDGGVAIGEDAESHGLNSIAMGTGARSHPKDLGVAPNNTIVIGTSAEATAHNGIAIGEDAEATEARAIAQGFKAHSSADDAIAFGSNADADGVSSQAFGTGAHATGTNAQASGTGANAVGYNSIATGTGATSYATDGVAMGTGAVAGFDDPYNQDPDRNKSGIAIGNKALADEEHALALGVDANARAKSSTAIGDGAEATAAAENGLAIGKEATVSAKDATAIGTGAEAEALNALAMGTGAEATAKAIDGVAIGTGARVDGESALAFGDGASATKSNALAFGTDASATGVNSSAIGFGANAQGVNSSAFGTRALALREDSIAFGNGAEALHKGSVALGSGSVTGTTNVTRTPDTTVDGVRYYFAGATDGVVSTVSVGAPGKERTISNVAAGRLTKDSTDAINGSQLHATNRAVTALGNNLDTFGLSVAGALGGDSKYNPATHTVDTKLNVNDKTYNNVNDAIQYAAKGWDLSGSAKDTVNIGPEGKVDFQGDNNISVAQTGVKDAGVIAIKLAENVDLGADGSLKTGNTLVNDAGVTVGDGKFAPTTTVGAGNIVVGAAGGPGANSIVLNADLDGADITGLTNTTWDPAGTYDNGRAATEEQLKLVSDVANAGWNVTDAKGNLANIGPNGQVTFLGDSNLTVSQTGEDQDGVIEVTLNKDIDLGADGSLTIGKNVFNNDGLSVTDVAGNLTSIGAGLISVGDADGNETTIAGNQISVGGANPIVISGDTGTIGGLTNLTFDPNNFTSGQAATEDQLKQVSDVANAGWNVTDAKGNLANIGPNGQVTFLGDSNLTVSQTGEDQDGVIEVTLNKDIDLGADGSLTIGKNVFNNDGLSVTDVAGNLTSIGAGLISVGDADGNETTIAGNQISVGGANPIVISGDTGTIGGLTNLTFDPNNFTSGQAATEDQLKQVSDVANAGWNVTDAKGNLANIGPNGQVTFLGDSNLTVSQTGEDQDGVIEVTLNKDIDLGADGSLTIGKNVFNNDGLSVTDVAGNLTSIGAGLISVGDADGNETTIAGNQISVGGANPIVISGDTGTIGGLTNLTFDPNNFTSGQAATEDQLKQVSDVANAGWNVTDAKGNLANIGPNGQVTFLGDSNLTVSQTGEDQDGVIEVTLNKDIDLGADGSLTIGKNVFNNDGLSVTDVAGNLTSIGAGLISVGDADGNETTIAGNQISVGGANPIVISGDTGTIGGLTNLTFDPNNFTSGQAATEDQLKQVSDVANAGWNVTDAKGNLANIGPNGQVTFLGDSNLTVSQTGEDQDGVIEVTLNKDIDLGADGSLTIGKNVFNNDGLSVTDVAGNLTSIGAGLISVGDADGNETTIAGNQISVGGANPIVISGDTGTIGGLTNLTFDPNNFTSGQAATEDQLKQVSDVANAGWNVTDAKGNLANIGPNGQVTFLGDSNLTVSQTGEDQDGVIEVTLNKDIDLGADGSLTIGKNVFNNDGLSVTDVAGNLTSIGAGLISVGDADGNETTIAGNQISVGGANPIVISGDTGTIGGLTNLTFDPNNFTSGQAATEDQLKQVSDVANAGWNVTDAKGNLANIGPNGQVTFLGDSNLTVSQTGEDQDGVIEVTLNKDIDLGADGSLTIGKNVFNNDGLSVTDVAGNLTSIGAGLISVGDADGNETTIAGNQISVGGANPIVISGDTGTIGGLTNLTFDPNNFTSGQAATEDQLKQVSDVANAGWNVTDAKGNLANIGPNGQVTFLGDSNLTVSQTGEDQDGVIEVTLNKDIDLGADGSLTIGKNVFNNDGLSVTDVAGNLTSIGAGLISVGDADGNETTIAGNQISVGGANPIVISGDTGTIGGLTNLTFDPNNFTSGQAATEDQLKQVSDVANAGWNISANGGVGSNVAPGANVDFANTDGNIKITQKGTDLTFNLSDEVKIGDTTINKGGVTTNNVITENLTVTGETKLGDNFYVTNDGDVHYDGPITEGTHIVNKDYVDNSINEVAEVANKGWNISANGEASENVKPGATVDFASTDNNIVITQSGTNMTFNLSDNIQVGESITIGGTEGNQTVINQGGVTTNSINVGGGTMVVNPGSVTIAENTQVNMGGNRITNVAPGVDGTDAVNVNQLNAVAGSVNNLSRNLNRVDREARAGTASAAAMANLPQAYLPGKSMFAVAGAGHRGESGYAAGLSTISDNGKWVIKGSVAGNSRGDVTYGAGVGYQW